MPVPVFDKTGLIKNKGIYKMASIAKAIIIGHLGKDPEIKEVKGFRIANFSVAVTEKLKGEEKTNWFKVSIFGKQADFVMQYISKGSLVYVDGKLALNEYKAKDGTVKTVLEITANDVKLLNSKQKATQDDNIPF